MTPQQIALSGRVITMNAARRVLDNGIVYAHRGKIEAVLPAADAPPAGFESVDIIATNGTIFPGLIELHNHLAYNILPLLPLGNDTPVFTRHEQWRTFSGKQLRITGPMQILGEGGTAMTLAIARYVECKCLVAGVTSTQGIKLVDQANFQTQLRGVVRNVEAGNTGLPNARARIEDIKPGSDKDAAWLDNALASNANTYLLHLAEGIDEQARRHFLALCMSADSEDCERWALRPNFSGIHAAALKPKDFKHVAEAGASIVWSPLSNLMLYGDTARVNAAKKAGVRIGLGSDWSPTGSKNLLAELKVAALYHDPSTKKPVFTSEELAHMATAGAAAILGWHTQLGRIEAGFLADLVVIAGNTGDPYQALINATEKDVQLVVIGGVPRYGLWPLMRALDSAGEPYTLRKTRRAFFLEDASALPALNALTLKAAKQQLTSALGALPRSIAAPVPIGAAGGPISGDGAAQASLRLLLDNDGVEADDLRPLTPLSTTTVLGVANAKIDRTQIKPMALDALTVAENPALYLDALAGQAHLNTITHRYIVNGLRAFYSS
jgi:cytosine/adenosine deaminase-related metal-dependent hydrolase